MLTATTVSYTHLDVYKRQVLKQWLLDFSSRLHDDMADARYNSKKSLIDSAKDYVHRNYRSVDRSLIHIQMWIRDSFCILALPTKQRGTKIYEEKNCCNHDGSCYGSVNGRLLSLIHIQMCIRDRFNCGQYILTTVFLSISLLFLLRYIPWLFIRLWLIL